MNASREMGRLMKLSLRVLPVFLLPLLSLVGCSLLSPGKNASSGDSATTHFVFEQVDIERHYSKGDGSAELDILIHYPRVKSTEKVKADSLADSCNRIIEQRLVEIVKNYMPEETDSTGLEPVVSEIAQQLGASYGEAYSKANTNPKWSIRIDAKVEYYGARVLTFKISDYVYFGGAHGSENTYIVSYQVPELTQLGLLDLILDADTMRKEAEAQFKVLRQIDPSANLGSDGSESENVTQFVISENFGVTKDGLLFIYNPYEIAPYSEGDISLLIPFDKLGSVFSPRGKHVLGQLLAASSAPSESAVKIIKDEEAEPPAVIPNYLLPEKVTDDPMPTKTF